ncbi:MAG: hypothetical protein V8R01_05790 [Bacilli bacterium]
MEEFRGGGFITTLDGGIVTGNTAFCGGGIHPDHLVMNSGKYLKIKQIMVVVSMELMILL